MGKLAVLTCCEVWDYIWDWNLETQRETEEKTKIKSNNWRWKKELYKSSIGKNYKKHSKENQWNRFDFDLMKLVKNSFRY